MDRPRGARGLSARHLRTVRPAHADRPKLRPTKTQNHDGSKWKASKNAKNTWRTCAARTVRQDDADRPWDTDRAEKQPDHEGQLPQIISGFPKRLKLWRQGFGDLKSVTKGCYSPKILHPNSLNHRESRILWAPTKARAPNENPRIEVVSRHLRAQDQSQRCTRHPSMFSSKKSGERPTQIRGITRGTKARKQAQKDHEKHNSESSIQTRKDSQDLACHPSIHPSQQISHEALMLA
jgi:hypothetical protein